MAKLLVRFESIWWSDLCSNLIFFRPPCNSDNTDPVVTNCPTNINLAVPFGTTSTAITWQVPQANDNSGSVQTSNNVNPGDLFTAGTVTQVSYTFTDASNNFQVCNFLVTIDSKLNFAVLAVKECMGREGEGLNLLHVHVSVDLLQQRFQLHDDDGDDDAY